MKHLPVTEDQIRVVWNRERDRFHWPELWDEFRSDLLSWRIAKLLAIQAEQRRERQRLAIGRATAPARAVQRPPVTRRPVGLDLKRLAGNDRDDDA